MYSDSEDERQPIKEEVIKIVVYNPNNFLATPEQIQSILLKADIKLPIKNIEYYRQAFTHKSYIKKVLNNEKFIVEENRNGCVELQDESNERLEFLGDSICNSIIVNYLFGRFPMEQEGFLTRIKIDLISTKWYATFAKYLEFDKYTMMSHHVEAINGRKNDKILENTFESFIGALFKDFSNIPSVYVKQCGLLSGPGYEVCEKLVVHLLTKLVDFDDLRYNNTNYKDMLQRYYHEFQITPTYKTISDNGVDPKFKFTMGLVDKDNVNKIISSGVGKTKKAAEQEAAKKALIHYGKLKNTKPTKTYFKPPYKQKY
jgi:ribonuclease-3